MKKNWKIGVLLIFLVILIPLLVNYAEKTRLKKYEEKIEKAKEALEGQYYTEAINLYSEASILNKKETESYLEIAQIYQMKNKEAEALTVLKEGAKKVNQKDDLYSLWGDILLGQKDYEKALEIYQKISSSNPEHKLKVAETYYRDGLLEKAWAEIENLEIENEPREEYLKSLNFLFADREKAREFLEKGEKVGTQYEEPMNSLLALVVMEDSDYKTLLLSQELSRQGFSKLTYPKLEKLIEEKAFYRDPYLVLGNAYKEEQEYDKALDYYEKGSEKDPAYGLPFFLQAQVYYLKGNLEKAVEIGERAVSLEPNKPDYLSLLVDFYWEKDDCEKTILNQERLTKDLKDWQSKEEIKENEIKLVEFYQNCQKNDQAFSLSEELRDNNPKTDYKIEDLYLWSKWKKNQNLEDSLIEYRKFTEKNEFYDWGHYHYSELWRLSENLEEAEKEKDRALELDLLGKIPN